ncbi:hypothetical protein [Pseudoflavonifractor capillosus]|uniref:hypothetical protein n=1 Tax=Pseudoflavonifractor capillosus TaxID=106588 RepID=UPI00195EF6FA|nr:hypothetical protein [Pseudoflavonifractor capillosus]MBM6679148.1 hypothetical protein [Pseudoflavonifractor capillosus]
MLERLDKLHGNEKRRHPIVLQADLLQEPGQIQAVVLPANNENPLDWPIFFLRHYGKPLFLYKRSLSAFVPT